MCVGNPIRPEIAFVSSSPPPGFMPGASWVSSGWVFNVGCSQDLGDQSVFAPREGDERIRVTFIVWRAAAPVVGSTFWEDSLFLVPISPCSGAGLRGRSEKSWLHEFLHYLPPRLIFNHVLSVPITHKALSLSSVSLLLWFVLLGRASPSTPGQVLLKLPSPRQTSPPPGSLP